MADNNNPVPPMQEDNNNPVPAMQEDNDTFFTNQLFDIVTQQMSIEEVLGIIGREDNIQGDNVARPEHVEGAANVQGTNEGAGNEPSSSQVCIYNINLYYTCQLCIPSQYHLVYM